MYEGGSSPFRISSAVFGLLLLTLVMFGIKYFGSHTSGAADPTLPPDCRPAMLKNVIDGDTLDVIYNTGAPQSWTRASVHMRGVVAPHRGKRAACTAELNMGVRATNYLNAHLPGAHVTAMLLRVCKPETMKGSQDQIADIYLKKKGEWRSAAEVMVAAGYAFSKNQIHKPSWCNCLEHGVCPAGHRQRFQKKDWWFD